MQLRYCAVQSPCCVMREEAYITVGYLIASVRLLSAMDAEKALCWFTQKKQEVGLNSFIVRAKGSNCKQQLHTFNDSTQYYKCSSKISQSKSFLASRMKGLTHICVQGVNTKMNLL